MSSENTEGSALSGLIIMGILALYPGVRRAIGFITILLAVGGILAVCIAGTGRDLQGFPIKNDPHEMLRVGGLLTVIGSIMTFVFWAGSHLIEKIGGRAVKKFADDEEEIRQLERPTSVREPALVNDSETSLSTNRQSPDIADRVLGPLDMQWHTFENGEVVGPMSGWEILRLAKERAAYQKVLVSTDKGVSWSPLSSDPILSELISSQLSNSKRRTFAAYSILLTMVAGATWGAWHYAGKPQGTANALATPALVSAQETSTQSPRTSANPTKNLPAPPSDSVTWDRLLKTQVDRCWIKPPTEYGMQTPMEVRFGIKMRPDGFLDGQPVILSQAGSPYAKSYQQNALQALTRCQPYTLPAKDYPNWQSFEWVFSERRN